MPLTGDVIRPYSLHRTRLTPYPVKAGAALYTGANACVETATGLAVPATDAAGLRYVGVVWKGCDNTNGSDGTLGPPAERYVEVDDNGPWSFEFSGTTPKAGDRAHVVDDDLLTVDATANNIDAGVVTKPDTLNPGRFYVDVERRI